MDNNFKLTIIKPAGNDTALVEGIVKRADRKKVNDAIMKRFKNVEQVGFYSYDGKNNTARLEMAGGEFCGNATRSLAYLLLNGKKGSLTVKVSGTNKVLTAGSKKSNTAFAQMPIKKSLRYVKRLEKNTLLIELDGISHLIVPLQPKKDLKKEGKRLMKKYDLLSSVPAAGVMFIREIGNNIQMEPIVWVRDIEKLFYETACASGTTAVGLWKSTQSKKKDTQLTIKQPSGEFLKIQVRMEKNNFVYAEINGPIKVLEKTNL